MCIPTPLRRPLPFTLLLCFCFVALGAPAFGQASVGGQLTVLSAERLLENDGNGSYTPKAREAWFSAPLRSRHAGDVGAADRGGASGDTYSLAPIVQDNDVPPSPFAMTSPTESTVTAGASTSTNIGANFYGSAGGTFRVDTTVAEDSPTTGFHTVEACVVALNAGNARESWVAAGQTGPGGETLYTWRLDVGEISATNTIDFPKSVELVGSYTLARNIAGAQIFLGEQTQTTVDGESVSGVSLLQFQFEGLPVEVADFDLAEICLGWTVAEIVFADGFESGDTTVWNPPR